MAINKPKFIDKFWPVSTIIASRTGQYKRILAQRMERSKYLIENTYGVKANKVVDTFIKAYLASDKDYPAPIDAVSNPTSEKDFDLYNQYILFLWEYYVKDKTKKPNPGKEKKPPTSKANGGSPGALTLYEGTKEEDLVDEEIDERILKLLGLTDIFDIDYGTYLTLLKERMVAGRMSGTKIPTEEVELLTNEWKRVKGKVGRFKIKNKKITADNIGTTGPIRVSKQQFFLAGKVSIPEPTPTSVVGQDDGLRKNLDAIKKSLFSIAELLTSQNKLFEKDAEKQRKLAENLRRSKSEEKLEGKFDRLKSLAAKVLAPVQNILDKILNFIIMTLLGRLVYKFMTWIQDPKNKKKIDTLIRFIGDWWPALLGAFVLFATPLGAFVRTIIGTVVKLTYRLGKFAIPKLLNFVKANPVAAALIGGSIAAGVGAYAATQQVGQTRKEDKKKDPTVVLPEDTAKTGKAPGTPQLMREQIQSRGLNMFRGGGLIKPRKQEIQPQPIKDIAFTSGGEITSDTGLKVTGAGKDTQLIAARPGEIVISKEAVDKYGANLFLGLNKSGGGTNIPKMVNNIQLAAGGGMVGGNSSMDKRELNVEGKSGLTLFSQRASKKRSSAPSISTSVKPYKFTGSSPSSSTSTPPSINLSNSASKVLNISQAAEQSAKPISQKMPFVLPLINNVATLMGEVGNKTYNFERRNVNIMPRINGTYVPEPPNASGKPNVIMMPPIMAGSKASKGGSIVTTDRDVPEFSAYLSTPQRKNNIQIYGIIGVV